MKKIDPGVFAALFLALMTSLPPAAQAGGMEKVLKPLLEEVTPPARSEPGSESTVTTRYLGLGPAWISKMGASGIAYEVTGGYGWDTSSMMIQLGVAMQLHREALQGRGGFQLKYFLPHVFGSNAAPYIEGGFGLGLATRIQDEAGSPETLSAGFALSGGLGVQLLRTADVHLDLGVKVQSILDSNELGYPGVLSFGLQFFF